MSYEAMSKRIALSTGGIHGSLLCETDAAGGALLLRYFIHCKALDARVGEMAAIVTDLLTSPDLAHETQLHDILFEMRNDLNASVISSGHMFAAAHAASRLLRAKHIDETLDGITQLRFLDGLLKDFNPGAIVDTMKAINALIVNSDQSVVSITAQEPRAAAGKLEALLSGLPSRANAHAAVVPFKPATTAFGIEISSLVNFVAKTFLCGDFAPKDIGHLFLLSKNLSADYLWNKVRVEGGAYGGMAMASSAHPVFTCASYRDPNLASTLGHFEAGLTAVAAGLDAGAVDQSIIATIGRLDAPKTPTKRVSAKP